jgi:hypothetical protein
MTVDTTFLPKTNGMVFGDRLVARSDKGRVFGLGVTPLPTIGAVTVSPDTAAVAAMGSQTFTAVVTGGDATDLTYKWTVRSGSAQRDTADNLDTVTYTFIGAGTTQIQCAVSSASSSNSPQSNIAFVIVS